MRVCLVGVGRFGSVHKRTLQEIGVDFFTVDTNGEEDYTDFRGLAFDHAIVCTPIDTHYHIARKLLLQGKHVFVEKPLAKSVKECEELLEIAKRKGLKLQCGYIERFNPIVQYLKDHLDKTRIVFQREGSLYDTAVHDIDLALWFYEDYPEKIDYADDVILLTFREGKALIYMAGERSINGINTKHNLNILKDELEYFLYSENLLCYNALDVMKVIERIN